MRIPAILFALVLILGQQSSLSKTREPAEVWTLTIPEAIRIELAKPTRTGTDEIGNYFWMGATKIYNLNFEPAPSKPDDE